MAFAITLTFNHEINTSLQVGDQVYHTGTTPLGGFDQNNFDFGGQTHIGVVQNIISPDLTDFLVSEDPTDIVHRVEVFSEHTCDAQIIDPSNPSYLPTCGFIGEPLFGIIPDSGAYISFSKNRIVNNNELLGYYGLVKFENDSTKKAELYSVSSGITENSK